MREGSIAFCSIVSFTTNHLSFLKTLICLARENDLGSDLYVSRDMEEALLSDGSLNLNGVTIKSARLGRQRYQLLMDNLARINQTQFLILDELFSWRTEWRLAFRFPVTVPAYVTIHNVNTWLKPLLTTSVTAIAKRWLRKALLRNFTGITVFLDSAKDQAVSLGYKGLVYVLPFSIYDKIERKPVGDRVQIVIPGMVDTKRRRYDRFIKALEDCDESVRNKIRVVLLGKPVGHEGHQVIEKSKHLQGLGFDIITFDQFIPESKFVDSLQTSDYLFSDILEVYESDGQNEVYGQSKDSGITAIIVSHALPAILPLNYRAGRLFDGSVRKFADSEDLKGILQRIAADEVFIAKDIAVAASLEYTASMRSNFEALVKKSTGRE